MIVNNRQIISVRIRGLAFRCATGSRREMILRDLANLDEHGNDGWLMGGVSFLVGITFGAGGMWWLF